MGFFSSDTSAPTTVKNTSQGFEGVDGTVATGKARAFQDVANAINGSNNKLTVNATDAGALAAAVRLGEIQAEANRDSIAEVLGVASDVVTAGVGFGRSAFEVTSTALDNNLGLTRDALEFASDLFGTARAAEADAFERAGALVTDVTAQYRAAVANTVTQAATTNDERLRQLATWGIAALAAVVLLPQLLNKRA